MCRFPERQHNEDVIVNFLIFAVDVTTWPLDFCGPARIKEKIYKWTQLVH